MPYLKELETTLAKVKASLLGNEESTLTEFKNAGIKVKSAEHTKNDTKKYLDRSKDYFKTLSAISYDAEHVSALISKATAMANDVFLDEGTLNKNMAVASGSIAAANNSIVKLSSDIASLHAKTASENGKTKISKIAAEANTRAQEAAAKAEECSIHSLNASILAAKLNAGFVNSLITSLSDEAAKLFGAINASVQTARFNMDEANADYLNAVETFVLDELAFEKASLNYSSAKQANALVRLAPVINKSNERGKPKK